MTKPLSRREIARRANNLPPPKGRRRSTQMDQGELSPRELVFAREYATNRYNGRKAALVAGYAQKSAAVRAYQLLRVARVQAEIRRTREMVLQASDVRTERVMHELAIQAFFDPVDFFHEKGNLLPINEMSADARHALVSIQIKPGKRSSKTLNVRFANRISALTLLARILEIIGPTARPSGNNDTELSDLARRTLDECVGEEATLLEAVTAGEQRPPSSVRPAAS